MEKKEYKTPTLRVVQIENSDIICTSETPTATGYSLNDYEEAEEVSNSIWNR